MTSHPNEEQSQQRRALTRFAESLDGLLLEDGRVVMNSDANYASFQMIRLARELFPGKSRWESRRNMDDDFERSPPLYGGLIPLDNASPRRLAESLLQKTTLYSKHTAFVLPIHVKLDGADLALANHQSLELLERNFELLPLIRAGRCSVMPQAIETVLVDDDRRVHSLTSAPMEQGIQATYAPLNQRTLVEKVDHQLLVLQQFILPYFPDIDSDKLATLVTDETESFELFMSWLTRRFAEYANSPEDQNFAELVAEIDEGVARLRVEAASLHRTSRLLRNTSIGTFGISLGALIGASLGLPAGVAAPVAGIVGSVNFIEVIKEVAARRKDRLDLRRSEFYIPYLATDDGTTN